MRLRAGVRLVHDRLTGRHVLVGPERGLVLDDTARAIVSLIDGQRSLDDIVDALDARAPREVVRRDVSDFLDQLARRRMLTP
jgi:pyrroloquinoline-quinone synthase/pyrroloquinoline quinone biosynthesis protein D